MAALMVEKRYVERMEKLREILTCKVLDQQFDIGHFFSGDGRDGPATECGSTGCLVGWYGYYKQDCWLVQIDGGFKKFNPDLKDVCEYFGLTRDGWDYLFDCDMGPKTRSEAIARVKVCIEMMEKVSLKKFIKWQAEKGKEVRGEFERKLMQEALE